MPVKRFTDANVRSIKPPNKEPTKTNQVSYIETMQRGLALVLAVSYGGSKTWRVLTYDDAGKPKTKKLGKYPAMKLKEARAKAREEFENPEKAEAKRSAGTFRDVAEAWFEDHVVGGGLRSAPEIRRHLTKYIYPRWKALPFVEVRRIDVATLLTGIAQRGKRSQADAVLATVRSIMTWYQARDEHYESPIVKAMRKDKRKPDDKARKRVLEDDEVRLVWKACDDVGVRFAGIVRLCLLTGQRKGKIATMRWDDLDLETGAWTIRTEDREKGNPRTLLLPQMALDIIRAQPKIAGNPYVFPAHTRKQPNGHFNSFSPAKRKIDALLPEDMPHWTVHDLRRTARTLMTEAGVRDDIGELAIGHKPTIIRRTYDRHERRAHIADALTKLAALIERIINPPSGGNVVPLGRAAE